jgi:tetratricopeptide (TPR) repeat protein
MGRKKALIIAVSEYDNDYPLKYCEKDGVEVSKLLSSPDLAYEIEEKNKLIGYVRSEEMRDTIVDFFDNEEVKDEDMLLLYYSGHGIHDQRGNMYLSSSQIDPLLPAKRGFSSKELMTVIENSTSSKKVAILDCCHSGSTEIGKGEINDPMQLIKSIEEDSEALEQGEGICILAASQAYQGAYPLEEQGHSIFTYFMLEGLRQNAESVDSNGNVTPYTLNKYISKKINNLSPEKRRRQKPSMKSETSGEIVLASYPKLRLPSPTMLISNTTKSEAEVRKGILGSKSKILIAALATVIVIALTLALLTYYNHPPTPSNEKYIYLHKGDALNQQDNYTQAIPFFDKALAIDPKFQDALTGKGRALDGLGNYTGALKYLDNALAIDPNDESALDDKGWALNGLGNYTGAITYLDNALAIDHNDKYALNNKGLSLENLGNQAGAIEYYDKALAIDPYYKNALNDKSSALDNLGNHTGAIMYIDKALRIDPKYEVALYNKGTVLDNIGNHTGAIEYFNKALAVDPRNKYALNGKGLALDNIGNHTGAIEYFNKALAVDPMYKIALYNKGGVLEKLGKYTEAKLCCTIH